MADKPNDTTDQKVVTPWFAWPARKTWEEVRVRLRSRDGNEWEEIASDFEYWMQSADGEMCDDVVAFQIIGETPLGLASVSSASEDTGVWGKWHKMTLALVNAIHRDKGVKTQAIGIEQSYTQALAMLTASPEPVPATNQAGEVDIDHAADDFAVDYVMTTEGNDYVPTEWERELIVDALHGFIADHWPAALATQPATSQEDDGTYPFWPERPGHAAGIIREPGTDPDDGTATSQEVKPCSTGKERDAIAETELGFRGDRTGHGGRENGTGQSSDRLSQEETARANEMLDLFAPLSVSSTWEPSERRTIVRAMLAYGDIVAAVTNSERDAEPSKSQEGEAVDYAEAARVMFEACRDRFMRAEQCYVAIDALAAAGFLAATPTPPTLSEELRAALIEARELILCIEQRSYDNCWWVKADDPETAVCSTLEIIDAALAQVKAS